MAIPARTAMARYWNCIVIGVTLLTTTPKHVSMVTYEQGLGSYIRKDDAS
jgi:hypothetical protein